MKCYSCIISVVIIFFFYGWDGHSKLIIQYVLVGWLIMEMFLISKLIIDVIFHYDCTKNPRINDITLNNNKNNRPNNN